MADSLADILMGRNALAGDPGPDEVYGTEDVLRMMNARRGAEDHEGRSALARLLTTIVPMSMLGIRSSRGVDRLTGARLDAYAKSKGDYGPDIMPADMANVLAKGYGYEMRPASQPDAAMIYRAPAKIKTGNDPSGDRAGYDALVALLRAEREAASKPFRVIPGGKED